MTSIKGHFDGTAIVLDEPAMLAVGQVVRVIVETHLSSELAELRKRTDEALEPTRATFKASGMLDDELADWLESETHSMRGISYPPE